MKKIEIKPEILKPDISANIKNTKLLREASKSEEE
jgi:hypothetical protein